MAARILTAVRLSKKQREEMIKEGDGSMSDGIRRAVDLLIEKRIEKRKRQNKLRQ